MNKEEFKSELKKLGLSLSSDQEEKFSLYCDYLKEYNDHTNLTSIKEDSMIYLKHFYDSLTLALVVDFNNFEKLLDIGSGAGFPGVVIKIMFPHLKITLLDSNNKKTKFLKELVEKLNLENIEVINERSEIYISQKRNFFGLVTGRAVADLKILSELSLPFVKKQGLFIAMKGDKELEVDESKYAIELLGGEIIKIENIILPKEGSKRTLIVVKKVKPTSSEYPRAYDKILKNPLKRLAK